MAEYIKREDAIKKAQTLVVMFSGEPPDKDLTLEKMASIAKENIEVLPSIDIVTCKDCKYWRYWSDGGHQSFCDNGSGLYAATEEDDYCSNGE